MEVYSPSPSLSYKRRVSQTGGAFYSAITYKERERLLELGDLLFGEGVGL